MWVQKHTETEKAVVVDGVLVIRLNFLLVSNSAMWPTLASGVENGGVLCRCWGGAVRGGALSHQPTPPTPPPPIPASGSCFSSAWNGPPLLEAAEVQNGLLQDIVSSG